MKPNSAEVNEFRDLLKHQAYILEVNNSHMVFCTVRYTADRHMCNLRYVVPYRSAKTFFPLKTGVWDVDLYLKWE